MNKKKSKLKLVYLVPVVAKKQSQFVHVHAHLNRLWSPTAIIPCYQTLHNLLFTMLHEGKWRRVSCGVVILGTKFIVKFYICSVVTNYWTSHL